MRVATLRGVQVEVGHHLLIIPESDIDRVGRLPAESVRQVGGRRVVDHAGRALPLLRLAELMQIEAAAPDLQKRFLPVVYVGTPEPMLILQVEAIRGEQEFLLKSLHPPLRGLRWYSGMTVNGQGRVVPVLQTAELVRAMAAALASGAQGAPSGEAVGHRSFSILVAEDSITSRIFLKNLLESMGHTVVSAGDGEEAWNELRRGSFDLLLTDVEMPVLDGYSLTEKVRAEPRLADLPVILVTALDSPQHRQRGLAAGADAYLVKNQFDHEQLLDTITRLVLR
jgi:two-component system chemotaxis sensor kinase CheA